MSRSRKRSVRDIYKSKKYYTMVCPRHGACSWCDRNRQHNKLKTESAAGQDLKAFRVEQDQYVVRNGVRVEQDQYALYPDNDDE